jgi:hypothetical protein
MKTSYEEMGANRKPQGRALRGWRQMSLLNKIPSLREVAVCRVRVTNASVQRIPCSVSLSLSLSVYSSATCLFRQY